MKLRSTGQRSIRARTRSLVVAVVLAMIGVLPSGCTSGRVNSTSVATEQPETHANTSTKDTRQARPPECPLLGPFPSASTQQMKGNHTVLLSWTASASDAKHADAVGYCIYRSAERKGWPAERLNRVPLPVTSCLDDVVEDGKKYYYVVRAISAKGIISDSSKMASARIPTGKPNIPAKTSAPFCRDPANRK